MTAKNEESEGKNTERGTVTKVGIEQCLFRFPYLCPEARV